MSSSALWEEKELGSLFLCEVGQGQGGTRCFRYPVVLLHENTTTF